MTELMERLSRVDDHISKAVDAVEADRGASPVLVAVVREFKRKSDKALKILEGGDGPDAREAVVEVEQAGDSAKYAAEADEGIGEETRTAVVGAHDRICVLKTKMAQ
jgi:hypothetical protein